MVSRPVHLNCVLGIASVLSLCGALVQAEVPPTADHPWRALHVINYTTDAGLSKLAESFPKLSEMGINCLILEVNYSFEYQSHPELREGEKQITRDGLRQFAATCRQNNIELV